MGVWAYQNRFHDIFILGKSPITWGQRPDMTYGLAALIIGCIDKD